MEQIPTEWEQDVAEIYVNTRNIYRPNTNIRKALLFVLLFVMVMCVTVLLVHYVLLTALLMYVQDFYNLFPFLSTIKICGFAILGELLFCFKYAIIGTVKLYQHYAPDEIRRRCLFMPTCSEYTIMAVRKFGCIVGLCKSYYRLVYRCRGNIYMIDYP